MCVTFVTCEVRVCGLRCRSGSSLYIYRVYFRGVSKYGVVHTVYVQRRPAPATRATHTLLHSEEMAKATHAHAHTRDKGSTTPYSRVTKVTHTHSYTRRPAEPGGSAYGGGNHRVLTQWGRSRPASAA